MYFAHLADGQLSHTLDVENGGSVKITVYESPMMLPTVHLSTEDFSALTDEQFARLFAQIYDQLYNRTSGAGLVSGASRTDARWLIVKGTETSRGGAQVCIDVAQFTTKSYMKSAFASLKAAATTSNVGDHWVSTAGMQRGLC
jgi:hypothetical protein